MKSKTIALFGTNWKVQDEERFELITDCLAGVALVIAIVCILFGSALLEGILVK